MGEVIVWDGDSNAEPKLVTVKMPDWLVDALDDCACRECMSRSQAIRHVVVVWVRERMANRSQERSLARPSTPSVSVAGKA